jgi:hypothetical protein
MTEHLNSRRGSAMFANNPVCRFDRLETTQPSAQQHLFCRQLEHQPCLTDRNVLTQIVRPHTIHKLERLRLKKVKPDIDTQENRFKPTSRMTASPKTAQETQWNMKKLALFNHKGGIGRTTLTVNIADALARAGKTVLVVDADPQCSITSFYLEEPDLERLLRTAISGAFQELAGRNVFRN